MTKRFYYIENERGDPISPFHDVPLHPNPENTTIYNMVVEIPRWRNAKLEVKPSSMYLMNLILMHSYRLIVKSPLIQFIMIATRMDFATLQTSSLIMATLQTMDLSPR